MAPGVLLSTGQVLVGGVAVAGEWCPDCGTETETEAAGRRAFCAPCGRGRDE